MIRLVKMKNCNFSNICNFKYYVSSETIEIEFINGKVYQYFDVPKEIACSGFNTLSLGSWLHRNIRGKFRYCQI